MTALQEARLNMFRATQKHCTDNPAITATVPAFTTTFTAFSTLINAIISTAQQEDLVTKGITIDKSESKKNLCKLAADVASQVFAYAAAAGNNQLKQQANFTYSDLLKSKDDELAPRIRNIKDAATANLTSLTDYGISTQVLSTLQTAIDDYQAIVPAPRNSAAQKKTLREDLVKLFADGDKLLKERLDKTATGFKTQNPGFLSTYKANRIIVDPGRSITTLKGSVVDAKDNLPISGAVITVTASGIKATSNAAGAFEIKPILPGILTLNVSAAKYIAAVIADIAVKQGQSKSMIISLDMAHT